jgi:hypothetical protein
MADLATFFQTTLIEWQGDAKQLALWLSQQDHIPTGRCQSGLRTLDQASAVTVPAFPDANGVPRKCHQNVAAIVSSLKGEFAFGWALSHIGPLLLSGGPKPPLYSRWVNHVMWRDPAGHLWEVTPQYEAENQARTTWCSTTFIPDRDAVFEGISPRAAQYVAVRPEGEMVAQLLNLAQKADGDQGRLHLLRMALAAIEPHGFRPKRCRVESIGSRTSSIMLFAE